MRSPLVPGEAGTVIVDCDSGDRWVGGNQKGDFPATITHRIAEEVAKDLAYPHGIGHHERSVPSHEGHILEAGTSQRCLLSEVDSPLSNGKRSEVGPRLNQEILNDVGKFVGLISDDVHQLF